jgi:galactoside alpha-1,3-fucosyltransferase 4
MVRNHQHCEKTSGMTRYKQADAVVYHMVDYVNRSDEIMKHRRSSQRFISTLWEPPINSPDIRSYNNFFNWTMTYRFDSHIFASYYFSDSYRLKNALADFQNVILK